MDKILSGTRGRWTEQNIPPVQEFREPESDSRTLPGRLYPKLWYFCVEEGMEGVLQVLAHDDRPLDRHLQVR